LASQRTTGASTYCGTADTPCFGANRTSRSAAYYGTSLSFTLGRNGSSSSTTQSATDDLARASAHTFSYCRSCSTSNCAADCCLGGAVTSLRVRQQKAAAQANDNQSVIFHHSIPQKSIIFNLSDPERYASSDLSANRIYVFTPCILVR
jgi:hypothetical protein